MNTICTIFESFLGKRWFFMRKELDFSLAACIIGLVFNLHLGRICNQLSINQRRNIMSWVCVKMYNNVVGELNKANEELDKYKACAVVGGDGEPIGIGSEVSFLYDYVVLSGYIQRIQIISGYAQVLIKSNDRTYLRDPSDCYSTVEAVPEGEE